VGGLYVAWGQSVLAEFLLSYCKRLCCYLRNIRCMNALENTMSMCNVLLCSPQILHGSPGN